MRFTRILLLMAAVTPVAGCYCFDGGVASNDMTPQYRFAVRTADNIDDDVTAESGPYDASLDYASSARIALGPRTDLQSIELSQEAYRSPDRAFCLACLIAGGGHFYTGEKTKGAALLGIAAAGLIGGAVLSSDDTSDDPSECDYDVELHRCRSEGSNTPLLVGAGIAAASWVYGIIDSRTSAHRVNARNGVQVGEARIDMRPLVDAGAGSTRAGMAFHVTF